MISSTRVVPVDVMCRVWEASDRAAEVQRLPDLAAASQDTVPSTVPPEPSRIVMVPKPGSVRVMSSSLNVR